MKQVIIVGYNILTARLSRVDPDRETLPGRGEWSPRLIAGRAGLRAPVFLALFRARRRQCLRVTIPERG